MPREKIVESVRENWNFQVGWFRDGSVQLGVVLPDGSNLEIVEDGSALIKAYSGEPRQVMRTQPVQHDSLWCDLSRHQINELIRTLRKARDQAYGADA